MFYNTPSTTYIWILANKKEERRKGKVQLINANSFFKPLRQSMGDRSREIPADLRKRIIDLYLHFEENEKCKILSNDEFGFSLISIRRPITENGHVITDKRGNPKVDKARSFTERVPYTYEGGIERFFNDEVLPYAPDAWIDESQTKIGYEISFAKYFYDTADLRSLDDISTGLLRSADISNKFQNDVFMRIIQGIVSTEQRREAFVDTSIRWVDSIPSSWHILYLFQVAQEQSLSNKEVHNQNLLSLSYGKIKNKDINTTEGLLPASFDTYQIVNEGNVVLRLTDLQNDHKSLRVGLVTQTGIITSAYTCLLPKEGIIPEYLYLILHTYDVYKVFYGMGGGVRQSIGYAEISKLPILVPPRRVQEDIILKFYSSNTAIEKYVEHLNTQIELLNEFKTCLTVGLATGKISQALKGAIICIANNAGLSSNLRASSVQTAGAL